MPLNCPKCGDELHEMSTPELVEVDFCSGCKGIFFDAGEASLWFEMAEDLPDLDRSRSEARPTGLRCPRCGGALSELPYHADADVLLDRCDGCRGLWFDAGEVPKVEAIAAHLDHPQSKVMRAFAHLAAHGYQVIGVKGKR